MSSLPRRRIVNSGVTLLLAAALLAGYVVRLGTLGAHGYYSGWTLLGLIVFLAAYNLRKMLPFLPLGSSAAWLQFHIYVGLLTAVLFAIHVRFSLPNGIFEVMLACLYLSVFLSGVVGLYITRTYPPRLRTLGDEVIYEHIPVARRNIQEQIEALVLNNSENSTSAITGFYRECVMPFLVSRPDVVSHLVRGSSRRFPQLMQSLVDQERYLDEGELETLARIKLLLQRKHKLDTQYALQGALKLWLFVHVPATYALLVFAGFHVVLVYAWGGGAR